MDTNIGKRIKLIRKELELTQEEFGAQIGVKGNTITGYERGSRKPSDAILNIICLTFQVNQTWLRTGEGDDMFLIESNHIDSLEMLYAKFNCNALEKKFLDSYFSLKKQERYAFCSILKNMFPSLSEIIGSDPLAPVWFSIPENDTVSSCEEQVTELLQKPPSELTDNEIKILTDEFHREIVEEKEVTVKSSASLEFIGSNTKKNKAI